MATAFLYDEHGAYLVGSRKMKVLGSDDRYIYAFRYTYFSSSPSLNEIVLIPSHLVYAT